MNRFSYQERESSQPLAYCELVQHPRGAFRINGIAVRPEWPRGLPDELDDQAREIVGAGVDAANKIYTQKGQLPNRVRVDIYGGGRLRVIVRE